MARPRTGSILQEGDHYVARVLLDGKTVRLHLPPGLSEARARDMAQFYSENPEKARALLQSQGQARGTSKPDKSLETFDAYCVRWLEDRDRRGLGGIGDERRRLQRHASPVLGKLAMAKIARSDLERS